MCHNMNNTVWTDIKFSHDLLCHFLVLISQMSSFSSSLRPNTIDLDLEKDRAALNSKVKRWLRKLPIIRVRWVRIPGYPREYSVTKGYSGLREMNHDQTTWSQLPSNTGGFKHTAKQVELVSRLSRR